MPREEVEMGVRLSQGGSVVRGAWSAAYPDLSSYDELFFVAMAIKRGEIIATTDSIPFSVGPAYQAHGDSCSLGENALCPSDVPLICHKRRCRRPCLSDLDCRGLGGEACFRVLAVDSKICL